MSNSFIVDARTIFQIGKESIEDVTLAVSEIVKNAYDADANLCKIIFEKDEDIIKRILFIDDGIGMTLETIKNTWLRIGTDNKVKEPFTNKGRRKIGEKGIGRFALNRIGNKIEIYTKKENNEGTYLAINFDDFTSGLNLQEIPIIVRNVGSKIINKEGIEVSGTKIIVSNLVDEWNKKEIEKIEFESSKLLSTNKNYELLENNEIIYVQQNLDNNKDINNFQIKIIYDDKLQKNKEAVELEQYLKYSLFRMQATIDTKTMNYSYVYSFHPYDDMKSVMPEISNQIETNKMVRDIDSKKYKKLERRCELGKIKIDLFAYDFSALANRYHPFNKITPLKNIIKQNGGVKVYRNTQRVYNYGELGTDWLELDSRRVNRPGRYLSNNVLIGSVHLNKENTQDLIEKTNREGFINNTGYEHFKKIIQSVVFDFSAKTEEIKYKIKKYLGDSRTTVQYDETIDQLMLKVDSLDDLSESNKKELKEGIFLVKKQLDFIKNVMLNTSINTMDYLTIMHDLEKNIEAISDSIENRIFDDNLLDLAQETKNIVRSQNNLIRDRTTKKYTLNKELANILYRKKYTFKRNKVNIIENFIETKDLILKFNRSSLIRILDNLIDNSIYWFDENSNINKIKVSTKNKTDAVEVIFEDNGIGFQGDFDFLLEPFVTTKTDEGIGLGLFIVNELMRNHNGKVYIDNNSTLKENSARITLKFPKGGLNANR